MSLGARHLGLQEVTVHDGGGVGGGDNAGDFSWGLDVVGAAVLVLLVSLEVVEEGHINGFEGIA